MLVACRLAGLSALEGALCRGQTRARNKPMRQWRTCNYERTPFEAERLSVQAGRSGKRAKFPDSGPAGHRSGHHAEAVFAPNTALRAGVAAREKAA